MLRFINK